MKVEKDNLRDDLLSQVVNKDNADGLSSNFTHQLMGKIEGLEKKKEKPLVPVWAWLLIAGSFTAAIVLAFIYAPAGGGEPLFIQNIDLDLGFDLGQFVQEYSNYFILGALGLTVLFLDLFVRSRKGKLKF